MICLDFRRAVAVDPQRLQSEERAHAEECTACREFLARSLEFEARLASEFRVPVPDGLRERVLAVTARPARRSYGLALAASVLAAIALAAFLSWPRDDPLALAGIDFVIYEEAAAIVDAKPTDPAMLQHVAESMGVVLSAQLGEMRYIGTCPFGGTTAHHVLVKSPHGKVTLLLIPERPVGARAVAAARGLEAAVIPAATGSVAIIADSPRSVARVETLLKST